MNLLEQLTNELRALQRALQARDSTPSTPEQKAIYGGQGLFGLCTNTQVVNASVSQPGIANWLNWTPSTARTNDVGILTYVDSEPDSEYTHPSGACEDCEEDTTFTVCDWSWCFGRYCKQAPVLDVLESGLKRCENQPTWRLIGNLTDAMGNTLPGGERGNPIQTDYEWVMVRNGRSLATTVAKQIWRGTGAGTTPNVDMVGLSLIVNDDWQDRTGVDCPGANATVIPFDGNCIGDQYMGWSICAYVERAFQIQLARLALAGLGLPRPEEMAVWAPPEIANALVSEWQCCRAQGCSPSAAGNTVFINAEMTDEARRENWAYPGVQFVGTILLSNNYRIPVYSDLFMQYTRNQSAMTETGDIFLLIKSVQGSPLLWGEHQNFNLTIDPELRSRYPNFNVHDDGMFFTAFADRNACISHSTYIKPRLVGYGAFAQGRLTDVCANVPGAFMPLPEDLYGGKNVPSAVNCAAGVPGVS